MQSKTQSRRAYQNFLLYRAKARETSRIVVLAERDDAVLAMHFEEAGKELGIILERREVPQPVQEAELLEAIRKTLADITAQDCLMLIRGNTFLQRLLRLPEVGGIPGLLDFCHSLPGASRETMVDPVGEEAFIRMYSTDFDELREFVIGLRARLEGAEWVEVTCPLGTRLTLTPRHWEGDDYTFELYTAPLEEATEGRVVYCSLENPNLPALIAIVKGGRITSLLPASGAGEVSEALRLSLERGDPTVRVVAELGLGTNRTSRLVNSFLGQMENETIRGTCHIDLGDNTWFGGMNHCTQHIGGIVWGVTIRTEKGVVLGKEQ